MDTRKTSEERSKMLERRSMIQKWEQMTKEETKAFKEGQDFKRQVEDLNLEKESLQKEIASLKNNISEASETFNLLYHKAENRAYFNSKEELTPVELEELIDNAIYIGKMIGKAEEKAEKLEHIEHKLKILNKN